MQDGFRLACFGLTALAVQCSQFSLQELSRSLLKARLPRESLALNSFALPLNMLSQLFCNLSARFAALFNCFAFAHCCRAWLFALLLRTVVFVLLYAPCGLRIVWQ